MRNRYLVPGAFMLVTFIDRGGAAPDPWLDHQARRALVSRRGEGHGRGLRHSFDLSGMLLAYGFVVVAAAALFLGVAKEDPPAGQKR